MNVWKSSWRGSLAATALCALWSPVATADEKPAAESATIRAKGDVRVIAVDVPVQISAEEVETFRFPEGQRPSYIKFFQPTGAVVAQTTEEQTARNRGQLDRARQVAEEQGRKERRERLQRQQTLTHKALELYEQIDSLGEGRDEERRALNEQLGQVENELRGVESLPVVRFRTVDIAGDTVRANPGTPHDAVHSYVRSVPADADEARLNELKRAVAELTVKDLVQLEAEARMGRKPATAARANSLFVRSVPQWQRSGVIRKVGADAGNPVELSIDMQDGTILGLQKLGEGVHVTLRGKDAKLDELKPEMPVVLTWTSEQRGWKLHTIDAEPEDVRRTRVLYEARTVPGPRAAIVARPPERTTTPQPAVQPPRPYIDPALRAERSSRELEGQVERMRGQMDELQKQISELRDLLKQKAAADPQGP